jgi:glutamate-1-semialdehyde aminotransferase
VTRCSTRTNLAPSQFESAMISLALTDSDVALAADAAASFFKGL